MSLLFRLMERLRLQSKLKIRSFDFIEKPLSLEKVVLTVKHAFDFLKLNQENWFSDKQFPNFRLDGISPPIMKLKDDIERAAPTNASILITGENGVGRNWLPDSFIKKAAEQLRP